MRKRLSGEPDDIGRQHHRPGLLVTQRWFVHAVGVSLAAVAVAGCGGESEEEKRADAARAKKAEQAARARQARAKETARVKECAGVFDDLQKSLAELGSRLNVGLSYDEYTTEVGDTRVAYDRTPFKDMKDPECLGDVGVPLEKALNTYAKAATLWGKCFQDVDCSNESIKPELQKRWSRASAQAEKAAAALSP